MAPYVYAASAGTLTNIYTSDAEKSAEARKADYLIALPTTTIQNIQMSQSALLIFLTEGVLCILL